MDYQACNYYYRDKTYSCSTSLAMSLIGGKWKSVLIYYLLGGEKRFSELRKLAGPITERTLSLQLKQLEEDGLISRRVYTKKPPLKVTYRLTEIGETLRPVVLAIARWGGELAAEQGKIVLLE